MEQSFFIEDSIETNYEEIYKRNFSMVWHICVSYMKNKQEAEDALQETFLRLIKSGKYFKEDEYEKAWLIVTTQNVCKNMLRHWWRKTETITEDHNMLSEPGYEVDTTLQAVMDLPTKYKIPIYLYYYMGYDSTEIAKILHKPKSTIRNYMSDARKRLKKSIEL